MKSIITYIIILITLFMPAAAFYAYANGIPLQQILFALPDFTFVIHVMTIKDWLLIAALLIGTFALTFLYRKYVNRIWVLALLFICSLGFSVCELGVYNEFRTSEFLGEKLVKGNISKVTLPAATHKKNLLFIALESMENNFASYQGQNLIPNINSLQKDALIFDGYTPINRTKWTSVAMQAFLYGRPVSSHKIRHEYYFQSHPNLVTFLHKYGYNSEAIIGSSKQFASARNFFIQTGFKKVLYREKIANEYKLKYPLNKWGISDYDLYDILKTELQELNQKDKPFFVMFRTLETHWPNGFPSKFCKIGDDTMLSSVTCADIMFGNFVNWLKAQDFYKNTIVVVIGDHLMPVTDFSKKITGKRHPLFFVLNTDQKGTITKPYSSFDVAPTILHLMGMQWNGYTMGFGVSLLSKGKTLIEQYDNAYLDAELKKNIPLSR